MIKYHVYARAWDLSQEWMDAIGLSPSRTVSEQLPNEVGLVLISDVDHALSALDHDLDWCQRTSFSAMVVLL